MHPHQNRRPRRGLLSRPREAAFSPVIRNVHRLRRIPAELVRSGTLYRVAGELRRWVIGAAATVTAEDGVVAFTADEMMAVRGRPAVVLGFHEAATKGVPAWASEASVIVPGYRGKSLIPVLSWLVTNHLVGQ